MRIKINIKFVAIIITISVLALCVIGMQDGDFNENHTIVNSTSQKTTPFREGLLTPNWEENDANSGGDAGDSLPLATPIISGDYNGSLVITDADYYTFEVSAGTIINVSMIPLNLSINFDLTLYDDNFDPRPQNLKEAGIREKIIYSIASAGNYSISITPATGDQVGNYSFSLHFISQNDFDSTYDAPSQLSSPLHVTQGTSNGTLVEGSDTFDFYSIYITNGEIITIYLESLNTSNVDVYLYDIESEELSKSTRTSGFNDTISWAISLEGDYKIGIHLIDTLNLFDIVYYNLSILLESQNDANQGIDAGNSAEEAIKIFPLSNSSFNGQLVWNGDQIDFYTFTVFGLTTIYVYLTIFDNIYNFDLTLFDSDKTKIYESKEELPGAPEKIFSLDIENGTYYISITFIGDFDEDDFAKGDYQLQVGLQPKIIPTSNGVVNWETLVPIIVSAVLVPIFMIIILIFALYFFTEVRIPWISNRLDKYFSNEEKGETVKALKYALKVRDETINSHREDLIDKDSKRAKDLETIHRLEEDQKSKVKVLTKLREEKSDLGNRLEKLHAVNDDLANIIDSTIRRQLSKSSKTAQKAKVSDIISLLWLSEERLINYIESIPLLNDRYIMDKSKNFILTKDYAREMVRQAYWKRVGAMHLKKIKQVKVANLAEDTNINIITLKLILKDLVARKEIPAPIHMDKASLLLSISDELISEMVEVAERTPIISLKEISKSYDTTEESARIIFEKISEEGYVKGEFINEDNFVVLDLLANIIISEGSINIEKFAKNYSIGDKEEIRILIEKLIQTEQLEGIFFFENLFLSMKNLPDQLKEMIITSVEDVSKGDTRRVVFDIGSVVESILKQKLLLEIQEISDIDKLPRFQDIVESKELGKILRAAEASKISLPSNVELKSLNRFWAQKIKHTKPGELPYIPTLEEAKLFLFEANRALNKLFGQKIPTQWKRKIAENLLKDK